MKQDDRRRALCLVSLHQPNLLRWLRRPSPIIQHICVQLSLPKRQENEY